VSPPISLHVLYGGVGGHRSVVRAILDHDDQTSHHLILLDTNPTPAADADAWGVTIHQVWIRRRGDLTSMAEVIRVVRTVRPNVSVCHTHRHLLAVFLGMLVGGRPPRLVLAEHQPNSLRSRSDTLWSVVGILLSRAVVFLTPDHVAGYPLRWLLRLCHRRRVVIPNGVPIAVPTQREQSSDIERLHIGVAGRLIPHKDVATVLRAVASLARRDPSMSPYLLVAGDGESRRELESEAQALGLFDRVEFLGALSSDDMHSFFESLDVYVHSSLGETLSMSILEAAATGIPIVASDAPGIRDLLTHEVDALLVPPSDPSALADALDRLRDPDLRQRLGTSARKMVRHRYPPQVTAEGYRRLVRDLLGDRR